MKYIVENWFVIVGLIAVLAAGGYAIYVFVKMPSDKQLTKVREWLLYAVTKAEKELGGGTGQIKLRYVYDMFVTRFNKNRTFFVLIKNVVRQFDDCICLTAASCPGKYGTHFRLISNDPSKT